MSKKKPLTIQFDIDGVLADFIWGFTKLAERYTGRLPITTLAQPQWDEFNGIDAKLEQRLWDEVTASNFFWQSLPPLIGPLEAEGIRQLYRPEAQVYFVTNRLGLNVRQQTEAWLRNHLELPKWANPTVIIARSKGDVARALMSDYAIDDKAENAWCISWLTTPQNTKTPDCKTYLLNRPYNQYDSKVGSSKIRRIDTVQEFLNIVKERLDGGDRSEDAR